MSRRNNFVIYMNSQPYNTKTMQSTIIDQSNLFAKSIYEKKQSHFNHKL